MVPALGAVRLAYSSWRCSRRTVWPRAAEADWAALGLPLAEFLQQKMPGLHRLLENKYYIDELYQKLFVSRVVAIGNSLWNKADAGLIDGWLVNGSARLMGNLASRVRVWQSGYLFHYAFAMIVGLIGIIAIWVMLK